MKMKWSVFLIMLALWSVAVSAQNTGTGASGPRQEMSGTGIRYVTSEWNWKQHSPDNLSRPGGNRIHLSPCPMGLDTTSSANHYIYRVYISGVGTAEAAPVTGGSCAPGASSGTITVTTAYPHAAGYTVGSASSGIQEAWNDAWVSDTAIGGAPATVAPYVKLAADTTYYVYSSVYLRGRGGVFDGAGSLLACATRDRCIYIGVTPGGPTVNYHKLYNLNGVSMLNIDGVQVASVAATSGTYTVTTASAHAFVAGDTVDCEYYSSNAVQHWMSQVLSTGLSSTQFEISMGNNTFSASAGTFGFCGLENAFVEDNSDHASIQDINIFNVSPFGMGAFSYGIVNDNDQQFIVERAGNRGMGAAIRSDANFPMGAFLYQRTDQGNAGIPYIHNSEFTSINCATAGGNGFVMSDTVCQGFPVYGVRYFGGYQPATFQNVYQESSIGITDPLYGFAGAMGYLLQGAVGTKFLGTFPVQGLKPSFASGGSTLRNYFVVPRSSALGYGPVLAIGTALPATGKTHINLAWPSIEPQDGYYHKSLGTITWDVLVVVGTASSPYASSAPYRTGGYALATGVSGKCGTNGICHFTDTQPALTSYTVQTQQFTPVFWFWPGNLAINNTVVYTELESYDPSAVASQGTRSISIVAEQCQPGGAINTRTPIWVGCLHTLTNGSGWMGTILGQQDSAGVGPGANSKGRLNFGKPIASPNDLITLADSNFSKTIASYGERPSSDAGDTAIGLDQNGGLSERAATSISSYINVQPAGSNYLERLTATGKTLNVPLTVNGHLYQSANGNFGGRCSMSSSTSCSFKVRPPYPKDLICIPAVQGKAAIVGACSLAGSVVTITAASPNSETWGAIFVGNSD